MADTKVAAIIFLCHYRNWRRQYAGEVHNTLSVVKRNSAGKSACFLVGVLGCRDSRIEKKKKQGKPPVLLGTEPMV